MKIPNIIKPLRDHLKHFALGLTVAAAFFGAGQPAQAQLTYDFTGSAQGWTQMMTGTPAPRALYDNGHLTTGDDWSGSSVCRSPVFYLIGTGDLTFQLEGGAGVLAAPVTPIPVDNTNYNNLGFQGVALRDVATDSYVPGMVKRRDGSGGGYQDVKFSAAELAPYADDGKQYTLDFIDYNTDSWAWSNLDNVSIPGAANLPGEGSEILAFSIQGIPATISGTNITLIMPFGTGWPNLTPTITLSPLAGVTPNTGAQQNFTGAVTYTVTAGNSTPENPLTKEYTVTVTEAPDGPTLINVNYSGGTNANMNGVYSADLTAKGSASQVAPAFYGGNTWNDFNSYTATFAPGTPGVDGLLDSKGGFTGVGLTTSLEWGGGWNDWSGLGGNRMLISAVGAGYSVATPIFTLTGLNPANKYDLYIASLINSDNHPTDFSVGGSTIHLANTGAADWAAGLNYVHFTDLIPSPSGTLVVKGKGAVGSWNGIAVNGFQLQDMGVRSLNTEALIYTFGSTTLGVSTVPSDDQIKLIVPIGTALNGFAPDITCSVGATLTPATATGQDFSTGPVTYTVQSEDGLTTNTYYATVILDPATITSAALDIAATDTGAEILNTGTLVEANHFGGVSDGMLAPAAVTLANNLTFGLDPAHMTSGWNPMHSTAAWSGAAAIENIPYKTLLGNVFWIAYGGSVSKLDIPGLTVGHNYRLQLVSDNPANCKVTVEGGMPVNWSGSAPSLLTATWTATDTTANVVLTRAQGGGEINFNGYALHDMNPPASFSNLTASHTITAGTSTVTLSGTVSGVGPAYPADGELVHVKINGVTQDTAINGGAGAFSIDFDTSTIPAGDYPITYSYDGNVTFAPAKDANTTLTVTGGGGFSYADWASANSVTGTPNEDSNNDGVQNGIAYFMGVTGLATNPGLGAGNTVIWPVNSTFMGTYEVQTSLDLGTWTPVDSQPIPVDGYLTYILPTGAEGGKLFVRLVVTPTP